MKKLTEVEEIIRLQTLLSYGILDTPPEEEFQGLAKLIASICDVPVALISLLDDKRQWYKAGIGIEESEVPREETICKYTLLQDELLEIPDTREDERVKENPHVKAENGIRFYAGVSLQAPNGHNLGTVCVADTIPRKLSAAQKENLKLLSQQVMALMEARKRNRELSAELKGILEEKIKTTEEKLFFKENEYQHLLDAIKRSNSVVEFSPEGKILSTNVIFRNIIGYNEEELRKMKHSDLVDPTRLEQNENFWKTLQKGDYKKGRFKRLRKDGEEVWMQATYTPVKLPDGTVKKVIKIAQDITTEIAAEKALKTAKEAAESLNLQKDSFIANVSHEIRTPIHAVIGFTELLLEQEQHPQKLTYLKSVKTAGDNLMFIINDILDLSKIEAGIIQMNPTNFRLQQVISNVYSILHLKAKQKQLKFNFKIDPQIPEFLVGDSNRLSQILINLLGNALKFTLQGKVDLKVSLVHENGNISLVQFKVTDTGMGIEKDNLEKIFQRFSQADDSISRKFGGTGLGLNISRQLVEHQHGTMEVKSSPGIGSTFSFCIPYKIGEAPEILEPALVEEEKFSFSRGRILLCEDNELNQRLIEAILSEKKYKVDIAGNGIKGIELFKQQNYDLVLMDLQMPQQGGRETTRIIRQQLKSQVPIVALTANFIYAEKEKCLQDGMNDYLSKPFKKEDLFDLINRYIFQYRQEKSSVRRNDTARITNLSLNHLEELSAGDVEFQKEMIRLFIENSQKSMTQFQLHLESGDLDQIKGEAHKMKTSFGIVGADVNLLQKLEEGGETFEVKSNLAALEEELREIIIILKKMIKVP